METTNIVKQKYAIYPRWNTDQIHNKSYEMIRLVRKVFGKAIKHYQVSRTLSNISKESLRLN